MSFYSTLKKTLQNSFKFGCFTICYGF